MRITKLSMFLYLISALFAAQAFALNGAIYTTTSDCSAVNANRYLWQGDVYLNGGPNNDHSAGFEPGSYYVQVTTPQGVLLGRSSTAAVTVGDDGRFLSCVQLSDILQKASNPSQRGYDTSPTGAEYKVWVSTSPEFIASESKTDNFRVDNPHIAVETSCTGDAFVNDTFSSTITVRNTGSCTLTGVVITNSTGGTQLLDELPFGGSFTWTVPSSSSSAGPSSSTTTASGFDAYFNYTATSASSCVTNVWALQVTKSANTSYTRDWQWSLTKTANAAAVTIERGNQTAVGYTVTATASPLDSGWAVGGTVTVHNPAPIAATLSALDDVLSDSTPVSLQCGGSAPFTIGGGSDLACTYSIGRSGPIDGTNNATATLSNNNGGSTAFEGSASYAFGDPTTVRHANATVSDAGVTIANTDGSGSAGWSLNGTPASVTYSAPEGGSFTYEATVGNVSASCDTYATAKNSAQLTDGDRTLQASASSTLYSGACGNNCTLTIGYWKTHAGFTGRNPDRVTPELPQRLGAAAGVKTVNVTTATAAVSLLSNSGDASNGVNKLYAQMLAAKLNIFRGASPAAVTSILGAADTFLASNNAADWGGLSKNAKTQVNNWASAFDQYNNGITGPGHCN